MDERVVWIHGIGTIEPGYSAEWVKVYNPYLQFPLTDFLEVYWRAVFLTSANLFAMVTSNHADENAIGVPLTLQEEADAVEVRNHLATMILARASAQTQRPELVGEWSALRARAAQANWQLPTWLTDPNAYVGEFVKYLVSRRIRNAVKEKAKQQLRRLSEGNYISSVVAHSWGTVVAYESLLDLEVEMPSLRVTNLFTLGSPLWMVRHLLDDKSGRKPGNTANWVNIHAQGDPIGAGLQPGFQVDKDYSVPNFGGHDAHGSYFEPNNVAVEHDIVAETILG